METSLGTFEDREVQASVARFTGRTGQRVGVLAQGEFVYVIAKARVNSIKHAEFKAKSGKGNPSLFSRIHELSTTNAVVLVSEDGKKLFEEAAEKADAKFGIHNLFSDDTEAEVTPE